MESLYTTYRPQTFEDVAGQRAIVGALERAVVNGTVGHAYLFCGPRGTGKTTLARILAKALECDAGPGVLPDGTCEQCEAIALGIHPDVQELDAASRNGVNDIRDEVISKVNFAPVRGRYKVYIIDEVHMLSTAAFNALLKTLEEPPAHVVFIFCTTDPQKVLPTVLSRVQRFNFSPLSDEDIRGRLEVICEREGFTVSPEAMTLIVRHAHGGMRDAISTLEQLAVFGDGKVDEAMARDLLGASDEDTLGRFVEALAARDAATLFSLVGSIVSEGRDLQRFNAELMARVRDLYVVRVTGAIPGVVVASEEELAELRREAGLFEGPDRLSRILGELDHVAYALRTAPDPRLAFEVTLTKLARPECDLTLEALAERVALLEAGRPAAPAAPVPSAVAGHPMEIPSAPRSDAAPVSVPAAATSRGDAVPGSGSPSTVPGTRSRSGREPTPGRQPVVQTPPWQDLSSADPYGAEAPHPASTPPREVSPARPPAPAVEERQPIAASAPAPSQVPADDERWQAVVASLPASHAGFLAQSAVIGDDGARLKVGIGGESHFTLGILNREDMKEAIERAASAVYGPRRIEFETVERPMPAVPQEPVGLQGPPTGEALGPVRSASPAPNASVPPRANATVQSPTSARIAPDAPSSGGQSRTAPGPDAMPSVVDAPQGDFGGGSQPTAQPPSPYADIPPASVYDDLPPWEEAPSGITGQPAGAPAAPRSTGPAGAPESRRPSRDVAALDPVPVAPSIAPSVPTPQAQPPVQPPAQAPLQAASSPANGVAATDSIDPRFSSIVDTLTTAFGSVEVLSVDPPSGVPSNLDAPSMDSMDG